MSLYRKGLFYVIFASFLWGLSGVCAQYLFQYKGVQPQWLVSMRLIIPGLILLLRMAQKDGKAMFQIWRENPVHMLTYSIFGMMAVQLTFFMTITYSNAATATVLQCLSPVAIAIYLSVRWRRLPSKITLIAIALALIGTFLISTHGTPASLNISPRALAWGLISAVAGASYSLYAIPMLKKWGTLTVVGWSMFAGGIMLSFIYPPWQISGTWDIMTVSAAVYIFIFGSLMTFYLFLSGVQILGSQKASVLSCVEPLTAAVLSIMFLNVHFGIMDWIGGACIVVTVLLLTTGSRQG